MDNGFKRRKNSRFYNMTPADPSEDNSHLEIAAKAAWETGYRDLSWRLNGKPSKWRERTGSASPWPKIVLELTAQGVEDIPAYITTFLEEWDNPFRRPVPSALLRPESLARHRQMAEDATLELGEYKDYQERKLSVEVTMAKHHGKTAEEALRAALNNRLLEMSALFRFCVAMRSGLEDVARNWRSEAIKQYKVLPDAYDKTWSDLIPTNFRKLIQYNTALRT